MCGEKPSSNEQEFLFGNDSKILTSQIDGLALDELGKQNTHMATYLSSHGVRCVDVPRRGSMSSENSITSIASTNPALENYATFGIGLPSGSDGHSRRSSVSGPSSV